ncbi:metallophosphoesterase family protein [Paenibacillus sp. D51F]
MDRIAIISDIHGNMPALEAVLGDISRRGIGRIVCLGDLIGKGPGSAEAVDRIRSSCEAVIKGNWDDFISKESELEFIRWHQTRLGEERLRYLAGLPFFAEYVLSGRLIRLLHASPESVYKRVQPWDSKETRLAMFEPPLGEAERADVLGYGDIHQAYVQHLNGRMLFNCGSVGNPLDMTQASYAVLEGSRQADSTAPFSLQLIRVPYDIEEAVRLALEAGMPDTAAYTLELRTGRYRAKRLDSGGDADDTRDPV